MRKYNDQELWFGRLQSLEDSRALLFCFPHAGSGASGYHSWIKGLSPGITVSTVQLPGREVRLRETPFRDIRQLVQALAQVIAPVTTSRFAFFGHSMGALIAFELAREMRRRQLPLPYKLLVSASPAPHLAAKDMHDSLSDAQSLVKEVHRLNGTPNAVIEHPELMALILPAIEADFELVRSYRYFHEEALACPITAYGGTIDPDVSRDALLDWKTHTRAMFKVETFNGDHFFHRTSEGRLLASIRSELSQG
jgi:surfactin synthase thioesterase subunit